MSRVEDLYETACDFIKLPKLSRWLIAAHFRVSHVGDYNTYMADTIEGDKVIFLAIFRKKEYTEFKVMVKNYADAARNTP